jgi:hypothetical protein
LSARSVAPARTAEDSIGQNASIAVPPGPGRRTAQIDRIRVGTGSRTSDRARRSWATEIFGTAAKPRHGLSILVSASSRSPICSRPQSFYGSAMVAVDLGIAVL